MNRFIQWLDWKLRGCITTLVSYPDVYESGYKNPWVRRCGAKVIANGRCLECYCEISIITGRKQ